VVAIVAVVAGLARVVILAMGGDAPPIE